ncbi:hypothetical protein GN956_G18217 [Arapaima gigas]
MVLMPWQWEGGVTFRESSYCDSGQDFLRRWAGSGVADLHIVWFYRQSESTRRVKQREREGNWHEKAA